MTGAFLAWRLETFAELASTSDLCILRAKAGEPAGFAVRAERQTAGRGSRGRAWTAPDGNLNLSVLLRPAIQAARSGIFPLTAGLAAAEGLQPFLPAGVSIMLKWPNDLMLSGDKLGGILIDAAPDGAQLDWLVIGIGVNLRGAPHIPGRPATSLAAHGGGAAPRDAGAAVLERLSHWLAILNEAGPAPIHTAWLARAHPIGTELSVSTPSASFTGSFAGLSPTGELLLNAGNRIERISTGEILLGGGAETCCW